MGFVKLGLKIISAKFGEDLTTCVEVVEKKLFSVIQNGGRINSAVSKNYHGSYMGCPKISQQINSYRPKHIFASCGHAP